MSVTRFCCYASIAISVLAVAGWVLVAIANCPLLKRTDFMDYSEQCCSQPRQGPLFRTLPEAVRPDDLKWVHRLVHSSRNGAKPGAEPAICETSDTTAPCQRSEPHDLQIVALNLLSEGIAFNVYGAVIPVLDKLKILSGQNFVVHADLDMDHPCMGLDLADDGAPQSPIGKLYRRVLWHGECLYHQVLNRWVGEGFESLKQIWTGLAGRRWSTAR
jgi:hypothetical protein